MPEKKLWTLLLFDKDRYKEKIINPATKVSFNPYKIVKIKQNGLNENIMKSFNFEKLSSSLFKFKLNVAEI